MASLNPYLNFNGNAEEAFEFYKSVFGTEYEGGIMRFRDVTSQYPTSENEGGKVMHVSLPIGGGTVLMGSDVPDAMDKAITGTNICISINAESEAEADKLFNGLSAGGQATMPMGKAFWGSYFGMLTDQFGVQWMVSYAYKQ